MKFTAGFSFFLIFLPKKCWAHQNIDFNRFFILKVWILIVIEILGPVSSKVIAYFWNFAYEILEKLIAVVIWEFIIMTYQVPTFILNVLFDWSSLYRSPEFTTKSLLLGRCRDNSIFLTYGTIKYTLFCKNGEFFHRGSTFLYFFQKWASNILSSDIYVWYKNASFKCLV